MIAGITNGVLFAPASEHVYFVIYAYNGGFSPLGLVFAVSNSVGHIVLFKVSRTLRNFTPTSLLLERPMIIVNGLFEFSEHIYNKYDPKFLSVIFLRCVPFYHSAVSIMAASTEISYRRFSGFTLLGNLLFFVLLNGAFGLAGEDVHLNWVHISLGLIVISAASFIIKRLVEWALRK